MLENYVLKNILICKLNLLIVGQNIIKKCSICIDWTKIQILIKFFTEIGAKMCQGDGENLEEWFGEMK